jgi:Concanavalin A-like lectin/glucanases superfamily
MKPFLLALILSARLFAGNGYSYMRSVTIDHTKVPNTDQAAFPVLVTGTYAWLATVANGGHVQSNTGLDIIFTSDSSGVSIVPFERVIYTPASGLVEFWINIASVSHTADTVFYIFYGKAGASDQSNKTGTWNSGYVGVWHGGDGTTVGLTDSTSNANNCTNAGGTLATATPGQIGGAIQYASSGPQYLDCGTSATLRPTTALTISHWIQWHVNTLAGTMGNVDNTNGYGFVFRGSFSPASTIYIQTVVATVETDVFDAFGVPMTADTWYYSVGTWTAGANNLKLFRNGVANATSSTAATIGASGSSFRIGEQGSGSNPFTGKLDEVHVSNVVRSPDWITTEYNNQNSPSSFYTLGTETLVVNGIHHRVINQ